MWRVVYPAATASTAAEKVAKAVGGGVEVDAGDPSRLPLRLALVLLLSLLLLLLETLPLAPLLLPPL